MRGSWVQSAARYAGGVCGRYATSRHGVDLAAWFEAEPVDSAADAAPNYNVAPTDPVPVVRMSEARRVLSVGRWGFLPPWSKDRRAAAKMINARAETVATSRAYAESFATRRALVPADGWYEWRREGGTRQAYFMTPTDGSVLAFAGIWTRWGPERLLTFSVLTTAATADLAWVHDRMPLLLPRSAWDQWLTAPPDPMLLRPPPAQWLAGLEVRPVGSAVGNVRNNGPDLTRRVAPTPPVDSLF